MEGLGWTLFFILATPITLFLLFVWWLEAGYRRANPRRAGQKRPAATAPPTPAEPESPAYLKKWSSDRRSQVRREHFGWQMDFDLMLKDAERVPPGRGPLS
jgi:hypothetical protein